MDEDQVIEPAATQEPAEPTPVEKQAPVVEPSGDSTDNTVLMAIVAYFIFFLPLLTEYKGNDFVKYHVKQSILLVILGIGIGIFATIPFIGLIIAPIAWMAIMVLWILGVVNAAGKKKEPLPIIGKYAEELLKF